MANVTVEIRGVALVYKIDEGVESRWRVLLPFDDCHKVALGYKLGADAALVPLDNFGKPEQRLAIKPSGPLVPPASAADFKYVLDMTSEHTHVDGIRKNPDWAQHSALLSIDSAHFSVLKYLQDYSKEVVYDVYLTDGIKVLGKQDKLAYSVKASIELSPGEFILIEANDKPIFTGEPNVSYTIVVDNECEQKPTALPITDAEMNKPGDMDMYYGIFSDVSGIGRHFGIRGQKSKAFLKAEAEVMDKGGVEIASIMEHFGQIQTADFERNPDKPCMTVTASKPIDFPT